jgi:MerR family transcriptional regulator, copper efflux regulator
MRISELSKRTHLKPHTIRFYEKEGLLPLRYVYRRENNYREYREDAVEHLLLIKEGQLAGFTVAELKEVIDLDETSTLSHERQASFIRQKIESVKRKIGRIELFRTYLVNKLALLEQKSPSDSHEQAASSDFRRRDSWPTLHLVRIDERT